MRGFLNAERLGICNWLVMLDSRYNTGRCKKFIKESLRLMDIKLDGINRWRCIGPFRGGRVVTVAGDPRDSQHILFWCSLCRRCLEDGTDAGQYWDKYHRWLL